MKVGVVGDDSYILAVDITYAIDVNSSATALDYFSINATDGALYIADGSEFTLGQSYSFLVTASSPGERTIRARVDVNVGKCDGALTPKAKPDRQQHLATSSATSSAPVTLTMMATCPIQGQVIGTVPRDFVDESGVKVKYNAYFLYPIG